MHSIVVKVKCTKPDELFKLLLSTTFVGFKRRFVHFAVTAIAACSCTSSAECTARSGACSS